MKMGGGFAAARNAMMGLTEEYKAAAECDPKDYTMDIYTDELYDSDQDDDEPHYAFLDDSELEYIEKWMGDSNNWKQLKGLGKNFGQGAKFIAICGDGNCFFSACSTNHTASKQLPNGTATKHNELRQKVCDLLVQKSKDKDSVLYKKMADRKIPLVDNQKALDEYIGKKRQTTGQLYTWSDNLTFEAMAEVLDRPVMQLTYPRYVDGVKRPELEPKFFLSTCGNRSKLPVFIHYNGINHYNTLAPKAWPAAAPAQPKPAGGMGMGMYGGLDVPAS